ncbi:hypothetical protein CRG98_016691, partial [Punica granatum]
ARTWEWTDECQVAFDRLKRVVTDESVLALPCYKKSFEVETDASDFAIGGVLMQDGHPIAFESWKLSDVERRYTVQEKEMTAVVHCLRTWRHYLLGSKFVVRTDNIATSYFQTATKRMKKWADKKRRHVEYSVGDFVLVKLHNILRHKDVHKGLTRRYEGPFQVLQRDKQDPSRAESSRAPIGAKAAYDQDDEQILADRVVRKRWCKPKREYLIQWKGLPENEASWEPAEDLWQFTKQIKAFYAEDATRASPE